ncbi:MAG: pyridoxamine 5'-phosphate oxidase [Bacteroidota bacterium]
MSIRKSVADIRKDYLADSLEREALAEHPVAQFQRWFERAVKAEVNEPNAMALATRAGDRIAQRIVLLKGFDERGFVFYTNYESRKGQELAEHPQAALCFFWPELEQQIRIEGTVHKAEASLSDQYYQSRGRGSRIGAWASPQSQVIPDRDFLEQRVAARKAEFEGDEIFPRPDFWGGYRLQPDYIEFWQGRASRLHDRFAYSLVEGNWQIDRLAP